MRESPFAQRLAALQARGNQTDGAEQEIGACAARDAHHLLAVDGQVVAQHTEAEAKGHHIESEQPATNEEEAVPREFRLVAHDLLVRELDRRIDEPARTGHDKSQPEEQFEAVGIFVDEDADGGRNGHREVVAQPVVADTLSTTAGGQHVDGRRRVGHGKRAEGTTMKCTHNRKQQQGGSRQIASKEDGEGAEADHQYRAAGEGIDEITAEGTEEERRDGIA